MGSVRDEIAKNLLYYRKKKGYTQIKLAELLGVTSAAISNWEKGANSIDIDTLVKACNIFGATLNDMYGIYFDKEDDSETKKNPITIKGKELTARDLLFSDHERNLITAYRENPNMQEAVDRLLGIDQEETEIVFKAAQSKNNTQYGYTRVPKSVMKKLREAPEADEI